MYVFHTPGKGHKQWQANKDKMKEVRRSRRDKSGTTPAAPAAASANKDDAGKKKLALSEQLCSALVTEAGLSKDHFQKIWDEACSQSGN